MGNLQIKDIPADLHEEVRRRAGVRSMTIRDYVLALLRADVSVPLREEWLAEVGAAEPADLTNLDVAELVRSGRDERGGEILRRVGADPDAGR